MMNQWDFNTPPELLEQVRQLDARGIGLDPCSNAYSLVDARTAWDGTGQDGLIPSWRGHGLVFMNPPPTDPDARHRLLRRPLPQIRTVSTSWPWGGASLSRRRPVIGAPRDLSEDLSDSHDE